MLKANHVIVTLTVEQSADPCSDEPAPRLFAHDINAEDSIIEALTLAWSSKIEPVPIIADEEQWRVDPRLFIVDGQRKALLPEARKHAHRGDDHGQPLAAAEPLSLKVTVEHHQRIEAD